MHTKVVGSEPRVIQSLTADGIAPVTLGGDPFEPQRAVQAKQEQVDRLCNGVEFRAIGALFDQRHKHCDVVYEIDSCGAPEGSGERDEGLEDHQQFELGEFCLLKVPENRTHCHR